MKSRRSGGKAAKVFSVSAVREDKRGGERRDRGEQREKDKKRQRQVRYFQGMGRNFTFAKVSLCTFGSTLPGGFGAASCLSLVWGGSAERMKLRLAPPHRSAPPNARESSC